MIAQFFFKTYKNKNLRNIFFYIIQNYVTQFLNVIFTIISVRILSISDLGKLSLAKSLGAFFDYTHVGTRFTIDRKIPECNLNHKKIIFSVSFYINLIASLLVITAYLILGRLNYFYLFFCTNSIIFANINLLRVFTRANGESHFFIRLSLFLNISSIILQIIGLLLWGIWGIVILSLTNNTLFILYLMRKKIKIHSLKEIRLWYFYYSINKGFIYFLNAILAYFATFADRLVVNHFGGEAKVGEYSIIFFFYSFMLMIPSSIGEMIYPEFIKRKNNFILLKQYIIKSFALFSLSIITIELMVLILLKPCVLIFFPKYSYLITPMVISTFAILPYSAITILYYLLFSNDYRYSLFFSNLVATIVFFLYLTLSLHNNYGYNYMAYSKILYSVTYSICLLIFVIKLKWNRKEIYNYKKYDDQTNLKLLNK